MKLRKRKLPSVVWAVVDRYDGGPFAYLGIYPKKREALAEARGAARWSVNGRLSVVRLLVDAETEVVL